MTKTRGYFTIAQGEAYQRLAYGLALSLQISQPTNLSKLSIGVTKDEISKVNPKYIEVFDEVIEIPWIDHAANSIWKLENEWKSIYMTPYDETIKLDADMLFCGDVSKWWDTMQGFDGVFATKAMTYRGDIIANDYYRKVYTVNDLPNVYSAFFYFNKSDASFEFFKLTELIFSNWEKFFEKFLEVEHRPTMVSTDVVFALAAKILNYAENYSLPLNVPTFVHLKSQLQGWPSQYAIEEDWTKSSPVSFDDDCVLTIANHRQHLPLHYHVKTFLIDEMIHCMERKLGI